MSLIMFTLSIISTNHHLVIVSISGFCATISESFIGAKFQDKYKLSNELVNAIQTSISATIAIFISYIYMIHQTS